VTDELGTLLHPANLFERFHPPAQGGSPAQDQAARLSPHHLSLMEKADVPISIVSEWAGHYDAAFTMKTYVHASKAPLSSTNPRVGMLACVSHTPGGDSRCFAEYV
jgi:hypothetical protein